ncbi:MAG: hypothetical protein JXQ66_05250 [Campylobacterales bacterium]|nr:hypothetical protein [Campylobacterales bacterium]
MPKKSFFLFLFFPQIVFADFDYVVSNTNIILRDDEFSNYNRLRFDGDYENGDFFIKSIGDVVQKDAKLYRFYGGYGDDKNRVVLGLQNIVIGVGRIWTPTNRFNPKNSYTIESDEVEGVDALSYTRYIDETSSVMGIVSQMDDDSFKYALRYKGFYDFGDFAIDAIKSDDTTMIGLEIEGDAFDSGAEFRGEVAYDTSSQSYEAMVGFDYGFVNSTTLIVESLYKSAQNRFYIASSLTKSFTIFLDASLLYIKSFKSGESDFISPSITYTLDDYNSFTVGALVYDEDSYYLKWSLSF